MTVTLELKITYPSEDVAANIFRALEPDNTGYIDSKMDGKVLRFVISADNSGTLRNAADDLLACVKIAEGSLGISETVADLDRDALSE